MGVGDLPYFLGIRSSFLFGFWFFEDGMSPINVKVNSVGDFPSRKSSCFEKRYTQVVWFLICKFPLIFVIKSDLYYRRDFKSKISEDGPHL